METPTPKEHVAEWLRSRFNTYRAGQVRIDFTAAALILNLNEAYLRDVCTGRKTLGPKGFAEWKQRADSPTPNQRTR